jgi:filamentous hemagglutinin
VSSYKPERDVTASGVHPLAQARGVAGGLTVIGVQAIPGANEILPAIGLGLLGEAIGFVAVGLGEEFGSLLSRTVREPAPAVPSELPTIAPPSEVSTGPEPPPWPPEAPARAPKNTTRLGEVRDNAAAWRDLRDEWDRNGIGDILSPENRARIAKPRSPIVDDTWIRYFPGDAPYKGEKIQMHHIGGGPITVPLPTSRHLDAHMPGGYRYNKGGPGTSG